MRGVQKVGKSWRVHMMRNRVRMSRYCATKSEAEALSREWRRRDVSRLTPEQEAEALICFKDLAGVGTLREAVAFYLAHGVADADAPKIKEGVVEYMRALIAAGRSDRHVHGIKSLLRGFVDEFGEKYPVDITTSVMRVWIDRVVSDGAIKSLTKRNRIVTARAFLRWAQERGWIKDVPEINMRTLPKEAPKEPEFYSAAETRAFFDLLEERFPEAVPHFAVRAFFGVREAEAERLVWDDVSPEHGVLKIRAEVAKTHKARTLDTELVPETGFVWLRAYFDNGRSSFRLSKKKQAKIMAAYSGRTKHNGFRKAFATMFTSMTHDQPRTMLAMGHTNIETLNTFYEAAKQPKAEAEAYFAVLPKKTVKG